MTTGAGNKDIKEAHLNIEETAVQSEITAQDDEELRRKRRAQRREQMRREKEKRERINRIIRKSILPAAGVICAAVLVTAAVKLTHGGTAEAEPDTVDGDIAVEYMDNQVGDITTISKDDLKFFQDSDSENEEEVTAAAAMPYVAPAAVDGKIQVGEVEFMAGTEAHTTTLTKDDVVSEVNSSHAILINESDNTIVAQRDAMTKIYPASMTKVLTVLVAAEHITNLDDEFTITIDITDYAYSNDCSAVGFLDGETVTVRDLFYGTILPSGGDAALGLATYVAGSQEAFVELMNEKLEELGIADTAHFTNCIGLYDDNHYCTAYDMAVIMKAAVENELCREVLSAHTYTTSSTEQHPDGITISNWFLRRIEDKDSGGLVLCGKTGFVNQSGSCAVSYYISDSGVPYICVTADTYSSWRCLYDHVAIYNEYAD
jgi:D-alanyl-D-alanine carboxypeptidase (penicillin-binding protein 5/6)